MIAAAQSRRSNRQCCSGAERRAVFRSDMDVASTAKTRNAVTMPLADSNGTAARIPLSQLKSVWMDSSIWFYSTKLFLHGF